MKNLQRLSVVGVFILVLTATTFAGDIETPGRAQPPPPGQSTVMAPGDISTPGRGTQNSQATSDSVAEIALSLLQLMLSVF